MRSLTVKQANFTREYLETGNATEAADRAYKPKKRATARVIGSENLTKPNIRAYLDERAKDAASVIYRLSQSAKNESVRLNASRDILDRAGYAVNKAIIAEIEHSGAVSVHGSLSSKELGEQRDAVKKLI